MKGLCYFRTHADDSNNAGVVQKCLAIANGFEFNGHTVDTVFFTTAGITLNGRLVLPFPAPKGSLRHYFLFYFLADKWLQRHLASQEYDFIWIRHLPAHGRWVTLLKWVKNRFPRLVVLLEMPTWPYEAEMKGWRNRLALIPDRFYRKKLPAIVDFCLHYGLEPSIWGIPCIPLRNGITPVTSPEVLPSPPEDIFRLVFVGQMRKWHAVDRVLVGLAEWYKKEANPAARPVLEVVGPAEADFVQAVRQSGLTHAVRFHGVLQGPPLYELLYRCHVGVGTLGMHRKDIAVDSSLKHRLYASAGLPFILATCDLDFPENAGQPWRYVPSNDSPVDITAVISWRNTLQNAGQYLRQYTRENLSWAAQLPLVSARILQRRNDMSSDAESGSSGG